MDPTPEQPFAPELVPAQPTVPAASELPHTAAEPPPDPSSTHHFFFGPYGLRAGWSLLIYIAILAAIIFSVRGVETHIKASRQHAATAATINAGKPTPAPGNPVKPSPNAPAPLNKMIVAEALAFATFLFASWLMAVIEHRRLSVFGLGGRSPVGRLLTGAAWGLLAMGTLVLTLHSLHLLVFDTRLLHGRAILGWGAAQLFAFLLVGLVEEYSFRGYLQFTLTRGLVGLGDLLSPTRGRTFAFWMAAVITSALFFFAHTGNGGETKVGLLIVFLAGILLLLALWRTGSLWWAIGFHTAWDWSQSFLYGVPDSGGLMQGRLFATHAIGRPLLSGGTDGPEGSLLCVPVILLVIAVLFFTHPSPQPPLEPESQHLPPALPPQESAPILDTPIAAA